MSVAPTTDSAATSRRRRPTPGERVELVIAWAAESRMREQLEVVTRERDERELERDGVGALAVGLQAELDEVREERDRLEAELVAARSDRDATARALKLMTRDLAATAVALDQARPIKTLCGALLHRYQPRTGRDEQLRYAIASASQLRYWREQYDALEVPVVADAG